MRQRGVGLGLAISRRIVAEHGGRLSGAHDAEERGLLRSHPVQGEALIAAVPSLADVRPIVRHHHEA